MPLSFWIPTGSILHPPSPSEILFLQSHFILVWSYQLMLMDCDLFMKYIFLCVTDGPVVYVRLPQQVCVRVILNTANYYLLFKLSDAHIILR